MLVAQARFEGLTLVTHDDVFDRYGIARLKV
jgi:PIN domain nuclease of toxin-antitoxin system